MATNIGPKIGIDGEAEYRRQLNSIIQQAKELDSEMRLVTSGFTENTTAQERNAAESQVLTKQIENQKNKLSVLNDYYAAGEKELSRLNSELQKAVTEHGENSKEATKAANAYNKQETALSGLRIKINNAAASLNDMEKEMEQSTEAADDLGDELDDASKKTISFGDVLKSNILAQAIVSGIQKIAGAIKDIATSTIQAAADVKAETAQFEQTFAGLGNEAEAAFSRVANAAGIVETRLKPVGTQIYAFARTTGMDTTQALELMERALNVTADSAAYYDRSLEEVSESLQSFLKGNYENDAALGLSATETTRNAKANELYGKSFNDLAEAQKQLTLLAMVEDANKLSGALGQAARESDGWENVLGNLNETWRQFQANVGAPFLEALIPIIQQITAALSEWMESIDWDAFSESVAGFVQTIIDNGPTIISLISGIGAGFVAWNVASLIQGVINAINGVSTATEGAAIAQKILNAAMNANPIILIISLIAGLITAIVTLWNTNDGFREALTNAWNAIADVFSAVWGAIVGFFTETIPNAWNAVVSFFQGIPEWWNNLWAQVGQFFQNIWNSIISFFTETIPAWIQSVIQWFQTLPQRIGYAIGQIIGFFIQMGQNVWNWITVELPKIIMGVVNWFAQLPGNIWNWLVEVVSNIVQWGKDMLTQAIQAVTAFFNSVIQWFAELPGNIWNWLVSVVTSIGQWGVNLWNSAVSAVSNTVNGIINWFKELPGNLLQIGKDMIRGLWDGIVGMGQWLWDQITGFFGGIVDGICDFLGINSPSKVFAEIGEYSGEGFGIGLEKSMGAAMQDAKKQVETGLGTFETAAEIAGPKMSGGSAASTSPNLNYGGFTINVYAAQGMDENALAELVMKKIQSSVMRKEAVFG